jgi:autoinducer-2 kinase
VMDAQRWVHASPSFLQFDVTRPQTSGSSECIRAIEESAAFVVRGHKAVIEELLGRDLDALVFTGGASCGTLWPQILADVTGVPVHVSTVKESTALGCALFAGLGAGLYPSLDDARDRVGGIDRICTPVPEAARQYDRLYAGWQEIYRRSLEYVDDDLLQPLWRAAGT